MSRPMNHLPNKSSKLEVVIEDIAHELGLNGDDRLIDSILEPCTVVIIGASGDLAGRKLLPVPLQAVSGRRASGTLHYCRMQPHKMG